MRNDLQLGIYFLFECQMGSGGNVFQGQGSSTFSNLRATWGKRGQMKGNQTPMEKK